MHNCCCCCQWVVWHQSTRVTCPFFCRLRRKEIPFFLFLRTPLARRDWLLLFTKNKKYINEVRSTSYFRFFYARYRHYSSSSSSRTRPSWSSTALSALTQQQDCQFRMYSKCTPCDAAATAVPSNHTSTSKQTRRSFRNETCRRDNQIVPTARLSALLAMWHSLLFVSLLRMDILFAICTWYRPEPLKIESVRGAERGVCSQKQN